MDIRTRLPRLICFTLLVVVGMASATRDWQECRVSYGERITRQPQNNAVVGPQRTGAILVSKLANRAKNIWIYVIDAGAQFYAVESKNALDIDIDAPTKYARKGSDFYILDRSGKEKSLKIVRQMSAAEAADVTRR